ncbi:6036_t:CDS:10, partial [Rhizophagus irregularis]
MYTMESHWNNYFEETRPGDYRFIGFYHYRLQQDDFTFSFMKESNRLKKNLDNIVKNGSDEMRNSLTRLGGLCLRAGPSDGLSLLHIEVIMNSLAGKWNPHNYGGILRVVHLTVLRVRCGHREYFTDVDAFWREIELHEELQHIEEEASRSIMHDTKKVINTAIGNARSTIGNINNRLVNPRKRAKDQPDSEDIKRIKVTQSSSASASSTTGNNELQDNIYDIKDAIVDDERAVDEFEEFNTEKSGGVDSSNYSEKAKTFNVSFDEYVDSAINIQDENNHLKRCINGNTISSKHARRKDILQSIDSREFRIWQCKQEILREEAKINRLHLELFSQSTPHSEKDMLTSVSCDFDSRSITYKTYKQKRLMHQKRTQSWLECPTILPFKEISTIYVADNGTQTDDSIWWDSLNQALKYDHEEENNRQ